MSQVRVLLAAFRSVFQAFGIFFYIAGIRVARAGISQVTGFPGHTSFLAWPGVMRYPVFQAGRNISKSEPGRIPGASPPFPGEGIGACTKIFESSAPIQCGSGFMADTGIDTDGARSLVRSERPAHNRAVMRSNRIGPILHFRPATRSRSFHNISIPR